MSAVTSEDGHAAATAANSTEVQQVGSKTYVVDLAPAFNIGTVPNGGYVAGHFLAVALTHVAKYGHHHVISAHWDFLNRSRAGRGTMVVDEVKIARNMSVLHISLYQDGQLMEAPWVSADARRVVTGSITCRDMATETGQSLDGEWAAEYPVQPTDLNLLPLGQDPNWELFAEGKFRKNTHWNMYEQKQGAAPAGIRDMWIEYKSGGPIKNLDLAYLSDVTPAVCTHGLQHSPANASQLVQGAVSWYPTLNIHMDFKKSLPVDGVRWLRLRTSIQGSKNGRYGCDVDIYDTDGDVVAQARHVAMIVDMSRNTAGRGKANL
ncbi:thioesterase family protein [Cordyceps javanica]|uniref:Thioesterase family protein n=1 Tax=Cordyceps javanica TaxID=43265 RepID=A0A545W4L3_9HYPO|nr:thioesterase family protein [Cordyceps javanica]TQW08901.1 thioesterase family protein [Cordyceps javanica]